MRTDQDMTLARLICCRQSPGPVFVSATATLASPIVRRGTKETITSPVSATCVHSTSGCQCTS